MITLRPPFRAENMEGLYNKVIKGQIHRIPERFSSDLDTIVRLLIQVHSENRPSCDQILRHPIIQKRIEYFKAYANDEENEDQALLKTIKIPKNLLFLSDKLPRPNYQKTTSTNKNTNSNNYRSFSHNMDQDYDKEPPMPKNLDSQREDDKTDKTAEKINTPIHVNKRLEPIKGRGKILREENKSNNLLNNEEKSKKDNDEKENIKPEGNQNTLDILENPNTEREKEKESREKKEESKTESSGILEINNEKLSIFDSTTSKPF